MSKNKKIFLAIVVFVVATALAYLICNYMSGFNGGANLLELILGGSYDVGMMQELQNDISIVGPSPV